MVLSRAVLIYHGPDLETAPDHVIHDGEYLQAFDVDAFDGMGEAYFTADLWEAILFEDGAVALDIWRVQSTVRPLREDGRPNRPLTALTIEVGKVGTIVRCTTCNESWDLDHDPTACTCPDGGEWDIK